MKPHFSYKNGKWLCSYGVVGTGKTLLEAWESMMAELRWVELNCCFLKPGSN